MGTLQDDYRGVCSRCLYIWTVLPHNVTGHNSICVLAVPMLVFLEVVHMDFSIGIV